MTTQYPTVFGVSFNSLPELPGYCIGDDGSVWGCWNNQGQQTSEWKQVRSHRNGDRLCVLLRADRRRRSHQMQNLVLTAFAGPRPDGCEAMFIDGDGMNVRLENLRWATWADVHFWSKLRREEANGCWVWTGTTFPGGYGKIGLNYKSEGAHRMAYRLAVGEIPDGLYVLHRCDNRPCCRPDHLFLGTPKDNTADMDSKGRRRIRALSGEENGNAKLTAHDVHEIRRRFPLENRTEKDFGDEFGVTPKKHPSHYCGENMETWIGGYAEFLGMTPDEHRIVETPPRQGTHEFTFVLDIDEVTEDVANRIYGAGCDDATLSKREGVVCLSFAREAASLLDAVQSAFRDTEKAGVDVGVVRVDDTPNRLAEDLATIDEETH